MKNLKSWCALGLLLAPLSWLGGCGGGGGGNGSVSPTATPTIAPTPTVGARLLVVQLRDKANNPVDGIVFYGATPVAGISLLATKDGSATFNRNVPSGNITLKAEVDGNTTSAGVTINATGTTITTITVTPRITPVATATLPPPPFTP